MIFVRRSYCSSLFCKLNIFSDTPKIFHCVKKRKGEQNNPLLIIVVDPAVNCFFLDLSVSSNTSSIIIIIYCV